jgi:hypothetical protein
MIKDSGGAILYSESLFNEFSLLVNIGFVFTSTKRLPYYVSPILRSIYG